MKHLLSLLEEMKNKESLYNGSYYIPQKWSVCGFEQYTISEERIGEINVNPYTFFAHTIEEGIVKNKVPQQEVEIKSASIYSMLPRTLTAWNHVGETTETGSFVKALALLPYLKQFNIDIIYLLPIFEYSNGKHRKGELGSVYAVKNAYKIDHHLNEPLLGEVTQEKLQKEFLAFVEACHVLNMKVMIDFAFRSVSRDNDWIIDHPDWFYWINKDDSDDFKALTIDGMEREAANKGNVERLYKNKNLSKYLASFRLPPNEIDEEKWNKLIDEFNKNGQKENILDLIEETFNITTAPAFSDVINDTQPAWTDVTFLKYYFDCTNAHLIEGECNVPFITQDVIKTSEFPGEEPNTELWAYVENIIPYYINTFLIDGARIDMAHALPKKVNRQIIDNIRAVSPSFILWSEEFDTMKSKSAKKQGYNLINGDMGKAFKVFEESTFNQALEEELNGAALPIIAALETPDTPRATVKYSNQKDYEFLVCMTLLLPNAATLINNGFEIAERQPMNLGLDNTEEGRFVLSKEDPFYGKLAFFDTYALHWTTELDVTTKEILVQCQQIKEKHKELFTENNYKVYKKYDKITCFIYKGENSKETLYFVGNRNSEETLDVDMNELLGSNGREFAIEYTNDPAYKDHKTVEQKYTLQAKSFIIITAIN